MDIYIYIYIHCGVYNILNSHNCATTLLSIFAVPVNEIKSTENGFNFPGETIYLTRYLVAIYRYVYVFLYVGWKDVRKNLLKLKIFSKKKNKLTISIVHCLIWISSTHITIVNFETIFGVKENNQSMNRKECRQWFVTQTHSSIDVLWHYVFLKRILICWSRLFT